MANTTARAGLTPQQWDDEFFVEYIQNHPFKAYMGTNENSIFQLKEDLTKKKGDSITFALVNRLTGDGVTGSQTLEGNEEEMDSRSFAVAVTKRRNGVRVAEIDEQFSAIGLRDAGKSVLRTWADEKDIDRIYQALMSFNGVAYASASEAEKDAWLVDNADRVLFGAAKSNNSGNDHSASLANIDNTADKLSTATLSLMKRIALSASPKIRPIRVEGMNKRFYVAFAHPRAFRDLKESTAMQTALREVNLDKQNNKLFMGGDLEWDGVIVHECDNMPTLTGVGAGSIDVAPVYQCGAQALGLAVAKRWTSKTETFDYGDKQGVAIECIDGLKKMLFGSGSGDTDDLKQHGVVTGYFAGVADA
jgi:N4-gp56 family major capsid protein